MSARSRGLRLAAHLTLPLDLAVEATAVVGKRGRGKTFTAKRLVEEVLRAGVTVLVIDPTDVWWGLRSGADGQEGGGLDVVTVGGSHDPDLPVREGSGKMLARLVLDGTSIVLSPKGLVKAARRRLVGDLLAELYDRADGTPILVVVDEADEYAPEGARSYGGNKRDDPLVLASGAVEDIVRRGRAGGLGSLLITQRVAVLSKNVLEQSDTLIALGVTGKNDIEAVASWIAKHAADTETGKRITASLPGLPRGTAWVWSPEYDVLERVEVLPITTFDSSRSPKVGEVAVTPKSRKAIDLAALGAEMERFAEEVKADDPKELRKRIGELERQLAAKPSAADPVEVRVEVPVLSAEHMHAVEQMWQAALRAGSVMTEQAERVHSALEEAARRIEAAKARQSDGRVDTVDPRPRVVSAASTQPPVPRAPAVARQDRTDPGSKPVAHELSDTEALLLTTLVQRHPVPMTLRELAVRARRSHTSSTTKTAVSRLRALGLMTGANGHLTATDNGVHCAGGADPMPSGPELLAWWQERLTRPEYDLLVAIARAPLGLADHEAYTTAGYSVTSSTPKTALSRLRGLGLVSKVDGINAAARELVEAAHG